MSKENGVKTPMTARQKLPRLLLAASVAAMALLAVIVWPGASTSSANDVNIVVYKTASCSCCGKWVDHLRDAGLKVDVENVNSTRAIQERVGVPRKLGSCHTAVVGDYWVEGHVPADLIQRLMAETPAEIRGISVPGMPIGSPGMEGPNPVEYDIVAFDSSGRTSIYATRQGRSAE